MLRRLTLTNFKSFEHAELDAAQFTVLIGANASGKSNLREALQVLHGIGRGLSLTEVLGGLWRQGDEKEWEGVRGGAPGAIRSGASSFTIAAELTVQVPQAADNTDIPRTTERTAHYSITVELNSRNQPVVAAEELSMGRYGFATHPEGVARTGGNDRVVPARLRKGAPGKPPDELFERDHAILSQVRDSSHITPTMRREIGAVIDAFTSMRFLDLQPEPARRASPSGADVLGNNGQNLSSVLESIMDAGTSGEVLASWIRELTPTDAVDLSFRRDLDGRVLAVLKEANGAEFTLAQASDGTVRFLAMLALFLAPQPPSLIVLEEIENGIHPHRLRLLLEVVEAMVKQRGLQILATTHSPTLVAASADEDESRALLVIRGDDGASRIVDVLGINEVQEILRKDSLAELMEDGWLEDMAAMLVSNVAEKVAS